MLIHHLIYLRLMHQHFCALVGIITWALFATIVMKEGIRFDFSMFFYFSIMISFSFYSKLKQSNHNISLELPIFKKFQATFCPHLPTQTQPSVAEPVRVQSSTDSTQPNLADNKHFQKALSDVTCYKVCKIGLCIINANIIFKFTFFFILFFFQCGEKGHYANRCHKGVLAFLSNTAHLAQEQREKDEKEARLVINIVLIKFFKFDQQVSRTIVLLKHWQI